MTEVIILDEFNKTPDGVFYNMKLESLNSVGSIDRYLSPVLQERGKCLANYKNKRLE